MSSMSIESDGCGEKQGKCRVILDKKMNKPGFLFLNGRDASENLASSQFPIMHLYAGNSRAAVGKASPPWWRVLRKCKLMWFGMRPN